jgi:hypothetical protein
MPPGNRTFATPDVGSFDSAAIPKLPAWAVFRKISFPERAAYGLDSDRVSFGGVGCVLSTVTVRTVEVAPFPATSIRRVRSSTAPSGWAIVFHGSDHGAATSVAIVVQAWEPAGLRWKTTDAMPEPSSVGFAVMFSLPATKAPLAGAVSPPTGAVRSIRTLTTRPVAGPAGVGRDRLQRAIPVGVEGHGCRVGTGCGDDAERDPGSPEAAWGGVVASEELDARCLAGRHRGRDRIGIWISCVDVRAGARSADRHLRHRRSRWRDEHSEKEDW